MEGNVAQTVPVSNHTLSAIAIDPTTVLYVLVPKYEKETFNVSASASPKTTY